MYAVGQHTSQSKLSPKSYHQKKHIISDACINAIPPLSPATNVVSNPVLIVYIINKFSRESVLYHT